MAEDRLRRLHIGLLVSLLGLVPLVQYHYAGLSRFILVETRETARRATESRGVELTISSLNLRGAPAPPFRDSGQHDQSFLGHRQPEFRWQLQSSLSFVKQVNYAIQVIDADGMVVMDTGLVESASLSHSVSEPLVVLKSDASYIWYLEVAVSGLAVQSFQEEYATASARGTFRTALLDSIDWAGAEWIGGGTIFWRTLDLPTRSGLAAATAYISGAGCYELSLNGRRVVPDTFFEPSWSNLPEVRMLYRAYDVLPLLKGGARNVIGIRTGFCKFGYLGQHCLGAAGSDNSNCRAVIMRLSMLYMDGTQSSLVTKSDGHWLTTTSSDPIRYNHLFHGEVYDARLENGWDQLDVPLMDNAHTWRKAISYRHARQHFGVLSLAEGPPITVAESRDPQSINKVRRPSGKYAYVYDFGQNMAGFATFSADFLPSGTKVMLKYAEVLRKDGSANMNWCPGEGPDCKCGKNLDGGNCANQTDMYIARGDGDVETYTPRFTYHGFRYVQIEGLPGKLTPKQLNVKLVGHFVHSKVVVTGSVHFSDPSMQLLNRIQQMITYTQLSNLHHHPTDCPQREKRGWMGDAQLTSLEASLNFDTTALYKEWMRAIRDNQAAGCRSRGASGALLETSRRRGWGQCCDPANPNFGCGYEGVTDNFTDSVGSVPDVVPFHKPIGGWPGDPSWGAAAVVIPNLLVTRLGEPMTDAMYEMAKAFVDFLAVHADPKEHGLVSFGAYGDWLALDSQVTPVHQVTSWSQIYALEGLVEMARIAGKTEELRMYEQRLRALKKAYHIRFWNASTSSYGSSVTANVLPLYLAGMVPPSLESEAIEALLNALDSAGNRTSMGIFGAAYILQVLEKVGHGSLALDLALETSFPSWGFMLQQGPGTLWETWDNSTNSHSHPVLGAGIGVYLYSLAGLRMQGPQGNWLNFELDPATAWRVRSATVVTTRSSGKARFSWSFNETDFVLAAEVPHGDEAQVHLLKPLGSCHQLFDHSELIWDSRKGTLAHPLRQLLRSLNIGNKDVDMALGSGAHNLRLARCSSSVS